LAEIFLTQLAIK